MKDMEKLSTNELEEVTGGTVVPYIAKGNENMQELFKKNHCSEEQFLRWNNLQSLSQIQPGQKLIFKF